jgi:anti-sigma regulatory factor (Ser/Thr protein kinase)
VDTDVILIQPAESAGHFEAAVLKDLQVAQYDSVQDALPAIHQKRQALVILHSEIGDIPELINAYGGDLKNRSIVINYHKDMEYLLACFSAGAVTFFEYNEDAHEINNLVHVHLARDSAENRLRKDVSEVEPSRLELELTNFDIYISERVESFLEKIIGLVKPVVDDEVYAGISSAIYEMLVNAMEHGNLGITGQDKETRLQVGSYDTFLFERVMADTKRISVRAEVTKSEFSVVIADEGQGFRHREYAVSAREFSGRGLLITRYFFDEMRYNEKGNEVTLIKRLIAL